jgi:hypothetical protein
MKALVLAPTRLLARFRIGSPSPCLGIACFRSSRDASANVRSELDLWQVRNAEPHATPDCTAEIHFRSIIAWTTS